MPRRSSAFTKWLFTCAFGRSTYRPHLALSVTSYRCLQTHQSVYSLCRNTSMQAVAPSVIGCVKCFQVHQYGYYALHYSTYMQPLAQSVTSRQEQRHVYGTSCAFYALDCKIYIYPLVCHSPVMQISQAHHYASNIICRSFICWQQYVLFNAGCTSQQSCAMSHILGSLKAHDIAFAVGMALTVHSHLLHQLS